MIGYLAGIAAGIGQSGTAYFNKKALKKSSVLVAMLGMYLAALPLHVILNLIVGLPVLKPGFWLYAAVVSLGVIIGTYLVIKAVGMSDFGRVMPLLALTPALIIVVSIFINNETPTLVGAVGVLLVALGAFVLNGGTMKAFSDKGAQYVVAVAVIYSFTSGLAKLGVQASNPFFFSMTTCAMMAAVVGVIVLVKKKPLKGNKRVLCMAGVGGVGASVFTLIALNAMFVSYAIALKRTTSIFTSIMLGKKKFGEKDFGHRLMAGAIMCAGLGLIAFAG